MFTIHVMNNVFYMMTINGFRYTHMLSRKLIDIIKDSVKFIHKDYIVMAF